MPDDLARTAADAEPWIRELIAARPPLRLHARDGLLLEDVPLGQIAAAPRHPGLGDRRRHHPRPPRGAGRGAATASVRTSTTR